MFFDHFNFHGDESEITVPQKPFQRKDAGSRTKACAFQAARTVGTAFTAESYDSILYLAEVDRYPKTHLRRRAQSGSEDLAKVQKVFSTANGGRSLPGHETPQQTSHAFYPSRESVLRSLRVRVL
jgi:hypothetical protein